MKKKDRYLTFVEHLEELRGRLLKSLVCIVLFSALLGNYADFLLSFLLRPIGQAVFTSPAEAFFAHIMIAVFGGLFLSMPFILYQMWGFISEAMTEGERKHIMIFIPLSVLCFVGGMAFGYFCVIPVVFKFFLSFSGDHLIPMITIGKYISFVGTMIFSFGLVFELPLAAIFLTRVGFLTPAFLAEKRRHALVLIFIGSAVLTPPDCISQIMMAIPLFVLYEVSVFFSHQTYRLHASRKSLDVKPHQ